MQKLWCKKMQKLWCKKIGVKNKIVGVKKYKNFGVKQLV